MTLTNDQYIGVAQLEKWYRKYQHQIIEISGVIGTGVWDTIQTFISNREFDPREIMYLSYDQKQVLDLAYKRYHAYYINGIIYKYTRLVDFDSLPVVNPRATGVISYKWKREVRKKIDPRYKLMVVFDSVLMNHQTLMDLASFRLPMILIRDPMLLPAPDTYTFLREPNIVLRETNPMYARSPIVHFAHKIIMGEPLKPGSYDAVTVVPRKQMNLYNLKAADMNIAISDQVCEAINQIYRTRILRGKDTTKIGERLIVTEDMHAHRITNPDEKKVKVYLTKGVVGNITKINKHAAGTRYVPMDFRPEFYHEPFEDLALDRHVLNNMDAPSRQIIPDEIFRTKYAYALTPESARYSHWDKGTIIMDRGEDVSPELERYLMYTAISRIKHQITIIV